MGESPKLIFGISVKQQVADRIQTHIAAKFNNNSAKAAESLGISRQRLFSYTSAKALPRSPMFDLIREKWNLDLFGKKRRRVGETFIPTTVDAQVAQRFLFDRPVTLKSNELKVVIKRKGPHLVANIEISTDVEIA